MTKQELENIFKELNQGTQKDSSDSPSSKQKFNYIYQNHLLEIIIYTYVSPFL